MEPIEFISTIITEQNINLFGIMEYHKILTLIECRAKSRLPQGARSVICCAFPYFTGPYKNRNVALYSVIPDYHIYINSILGIICDKLSNRYTNFAFEHFADISPIPEVFCAIEAGLGFRGKNNLLITKDYGSYVLLGEIVTDMPLKPSTPNRESCLNCTQCEKNCPGKAIGQLSTDYTKCVSKLTQQKGELTLDEEAAIEQAALAWGCDRCQEVCPYNKLPKQTHLKAFLNDTAPLLTDENMSALIKTRAYGYKGEKLLKRNLEILKK